VKNIVGEVAKMLLDEENGHGVIMDLLVLKLLINNILDRPVFLCSWSFGYKPNESTKTHPSGIATVGFGSKEFGLSVTTIAQSMLSLWYFLST
jgi:hypothetical protein